MNGTPQDPSASEPKKDSEPKKEEDGKSAAKTGITSIAMLVAPLLAAIGGLALTGTIGRVQRDEPCWFSVAIGLVIAAGVLWAVAETFFAAPNASAKAKRLNNPARVLAFLLAGIGFVLALSLAVATVNNEPRPQINPVLNEDQTELTINLTASSLPTEDRVAFRVNLKEGEEVVSTPLKAYIGPDSDGNVDQTLKAPLPEGGFTEIEIKASTGSLPATCSEFEKVLDDKTFKSGTGCVIIVVPPRKDPPPTGKTKTGKPPKPPKPPQPPKTKDPDPPMQTTEG